MVVMEVVEVMVLVMDNLKQSNIHAVGVPEGVNRKNKTEEISKDMMPKNF